MAKIFTLCAEYQLHLQSGWSRWLRRFTRKPHWKRVSKYDNIIGSVGNTRSDKSSLQLGRKPTRVCKKTAASPSRRPTLPSKQPSSHSRDGSFNRKINGSMDALVQMLLSEDFLDEVRFLVRGHEITKANRIQADKIANHIYDLRDESQDIRYHLMEDEREGISPSTDSFQRELRQSERLAAEADFLQEEQGDPLEAQIRHEGRYLYQAYESLTERVKPAFEQAGFLEMGLDDEAVKARLAQPLPHNNPGIVQETEREDEPSDYGGDGNSQSLVQHEETTALRDERRRAFQSYCQAKDDLQSHREMYFQQLSNHLNSIRPASGWSIWNAAWSKSDFDGAHLQQSMLYSNAVRETEAALFNAIDQANAGGVSPMLTGQIFGFPDRPDDDPADSVNSAPSAAGIDAWRNTLPLSPPLPEPFGPDVVQYPSEQMSGLEGDVEAWETWSQRDEDVQRKRLLEKYRGPRPLGWTLPAEEGGVNGGDGGRSMNSHMI